MKVYRGPRSSENLKLTDDIELNGNDSEIKPGALIFVDVNLTKDGEKLSDVAIELDEIDFELIHANYVHFLKEKIRKYESELEKYKIAWQSIENLSYNSRYLNYSNIKVFEKINPLIHDVIYNQQVSEINIIERLSFKSIIDQSDEISFQESLEVMNVLCNKFPVEMESLVKSCAKTNNLYSDIIEFMVGLDNPKLINHFTNCNDHSIKTTSEWLNSIVQFLPNLK